MASILIIEDDGTFSLLLESFLARHGYAVTTAADIASGRQCLQKNTYDLVLQDYRLPDGTGMDILDLLRNEGLQIPVIIMTSFHDIRTAIATIRSGAYDYITKPVNPDELLLAIKEILGRKEAPLKATPKSSSQFVDGKGGASKKLREYIQLVAPTDFSVIIQGESGTGKELTARSIHDESKRKKSPFIALDCGALSSDLAGSELFGHIKGAFTGALQNKRGLFEEANGGTLFLDEVGNLGYEIQVKLLRALQEREIQPIGSNQLIKVDVRIICATNDNLLNAVKNGKFREDLYHRLNEFRIDIPALRARKEDMSLFINYFVKQTNDELSKKVTGVSKEVFEIFLSYDWPGNLRELRNIIKRSVLLAQNSEITTADLPQEMISSIQRQPKPDTTDLKSMQELNEKELILKTLEEVKHNKAKAARMLNIDRTTLYYKLSKYNIR